MAAKSLNPNVRVVGVEPEHGADTALSLRQGRRMSIPIPATIADGLTHATPAPLPFEINHALLDQVVTVSDAEIVEAMAAAFSHLKVVVEPSGACALAAAMCGRIEILSGTIGVFLSGGTSDGPRSGRWSAAPRLLGAMVGCLACTPRACDAQQALHDGVGLFTQYMSPVRIDGIAYHGADAAVDPLWHLSGAVSRAEYGRWCRHACGMACLQMILDHRDGRTPPLLELLRGCRAYGGYVEHDDGQIKGLYYAPFAEYVRVEHGLHADVHPHLAVTDLPALLADGHLVIVSVHKEIRRPEVPAPGRGGHLVLLTGHDHGLLHLHNPSGHTPQARRASLPIDVFEPFFGCRGIALRTS